ncbi:MULTISPECIES: hypothetical protein [unclassified Mucilaginibacter]|uniref:hypothetical protein n=1 Tax=unclassified Mucilaginibacter TaxID=2617802 RepID=UPI002AC8B9A4|nr:MULTISPECIES: hypothetical protein [unclassified Mucilaginibacter]MEB0260746.1 hypothetical protein [Mucilaginibacter sp. 10I4]MEB0302360.1 hypothetical protein [Mucilaginibacter sp. 5C4]WPX22148.1 hypothetical protein RHM67_12735 [Mucilaginibacter sp. 5C4]
MALTTRKKKPSMVMRLRAKIRALSAKRKTSKKTKTMRFNNRSSRSFRSPFRGRSSFRQRRSGGGGFSRRVPLLGFRMPSILIWIAVIGGGMFFGKDYIKPMIDRFTKK